MKILQILPFSDLCTNKRVDEVTYHLSDTFANFEATKILHSDNWRKFRNQIIRISCETWSDIKILHCKLRRKSQSSVEQTNQDIENMLATWMEIDKITTWSEGFVIDF